MTFVDDDPPTYAILMVVHNAVDMVRVSTLKTLQNIAGQSARFIVVDSGSNDGADIWLSLLADRGDIQLVRTASNIGHGPGLELARASSSSRFIVTLDSDAFPLVSVWLQRLRERLNEDVQVAGICHHRDYIHPSCLIIERATLNDLKLTFLNEKDSPSGFDVGERISAELKGRSFRIGGLQRTDFRCRGSVAEPVDLGATYEDIVYHQWYTTRSLVSQGSQVDDVPQQAIEDSLEALFQGVNSEPREATIVMGVRARPGEPDRLQDAISCLRALNLQDIARWRYQIIVIEQDSEPRLRTLLAPYSDRYCFAENAGLYNRGWGFNVGAWMTNGPGFLCMIDADLLVPPDFVRRALEALAVGKHAFLPYQEILYLDEASTARAIAGENPETGTGQVFDTSEGGAIWVSAELYKTVGGHDERFQGWGYEDREFYDRLRRLSGVDRLAGRLYHLHHQHREPANSDCVKANECLLQAIESGHAAPPSAHPGNPKRFADDARNYQNWHAWELERIREIVNNERHWPSQSSPRAFLANHLNRLGSSLLDVGCGPGALWHRLRELGNQLCWTGVDVTRKMLMVAHQEFPEVPVCQADSDQLPFDNSSFDVVLLRHVLEHLPIAEKDAALYEAMRVARKAVVLDFYVAPTRSGLRESLRLPGDFLETRWTVEDICGPASSRQWRVRERFALREHAGERNEVWVFEPAISQNPVSIGPKVSIVVPTFRRPHTLLRTIDTVRAQRYSNWELLVIDNAGDGEYMFGDFRVQVHVLTERASASYARNAAIERATGDLICFFDDDDDMFSDYLEKIVGAFQSHPQANMVRCGMVLPGGHADYSFATPECCIRRQFATATWESCDCHDQVYFAGIAARNGWTTENGSIVKVGETLCRANKESVGGLREGRF